MKERFIDDHFGGIEILNDVQRQESELTPTYVNLFNYPQGIHTALLYTNTTIDSIPVDGSAPVCVLRVRAVDNLHGNIKRGAGKVIPLGFNGPRMLNLHIDSVGGEPLPREMVITETGVDVAIDIMGEYQVIQLDASGS